MSEDDDDVLIVAENSPANDRLARIFSWLGLAGAVGLVGWALQNVIV